MSSPLDQLRAAQSEDNQYVHIVSNTQWLLDRLRLKIPRALCGASLIGNPGEADALEEGAPTCPKCLKLCPEFPGRRP